VLIQSKRNKSIANPRKINSKTDRCPFYFKIFPNNNWVNASWVKVGASQL